MKIYLLRHASPMEQATSGKDSDRPLSIQGFQESAQLGEQLRIMTPPCEVWCSSAVRTCETLTEIAKKWKPLACSYSPKLYMATKEVYLNLICNSSGSDDLMIIGHNYGISDLLLYLTGTHVLLEPAEFVEIEFTAMARCEISFETGTIARRYRPPSPLVYKYN